MYSNSPSPARKSIAGFLAAQSSRISHLWHRLRLRVCYLPKQWVILLASNPQNKSLSWQDFKPVLPPADRDWADPFILADQGLYYIFIEEKLYATKRGRIVCLTVSQRMEIQSYQVVLERPYHLSYPFILKYNGQLYMIPETAQNNQIELYRCIRFPDQWIFEKPLIKNIKAVDSTLVEYEGKWWLFANIIEPGGNSWDTLHLYFSNDPLSNNWIAHPQNPIVKDMHLARPAGAIQKSGQYLIRPSQDCSIRYGYATNFNRITKMTENAYAENRQSIYPPLENGPYIGVHTWNQANGLVAIDAIFRRKRFSSPASIFPKKLLHPSPKPYS